ncbi:hypothetical protein [Brucella pituitosa]|uniref:hypothetical protein n=1 Tax=Brucella pituitosa TaxID=571256 RepID=UPI0009A1AB5A|nr:hypothetical protein [Brucella pituitosa]
MEPNFTRIKIVLKAAYNCLQKHSCNQFFPICLVSLFLFGASNSSFSATVSETCSIDTAPKVDEEEIQTKGALASIHSAPAPTSITRAPLLDEPYRKYSGIWKGQWEGTLDAKLIPFEQSGERLRACYTWGTNLHSREGGGRILDGVITGDTIVFPMGDSATFTFAPQDDGTIYGVFYDKGLIKPSRIIMHRYCEIGGPATQEECPQSK